MMEIVVLIGNFNLRNWGSVFSKKPKLGSYRSSKPNFRLLYRRTLCRMLFTKEWALKQSNLLAPLPLIGALGNSTSNNHSSVGSSSGKCAFSNSFSNSRNSKKHNSRNSAKDVTERSVQEFSHVLSNLCYLMTRV